MCRPNVHSSNFQGANPEAIKMKNWKRKDKEKGTVKKNIEQRFKGVDP